MPKRSRALQVRQWHAETTPGTPVPADTRSPNGKFMLEQAGDPNKVYVPTGQLVASDSVSGMTWGAGNYESPWSFCEIYQIFNSLFKHVNPTGASLAKTRVWTPAANAEDTYDVYSFDGGQNGALRKFAYVFFNSLKGTISKQDMSPLTGDMMGQWLGNSTGSLVSATTLPSELVGSIMWDAFTADTFAHLASAPSQLTDQWKVAIDYGPVRDTAAFINSANPSWDAAGIGDPIKNKIDITVPYDVSGSDYAGQFTEAKKRAGTPIFLRYVATGAFIENDGMADIYEQLIIDMCVKIIGYPKDTDIKPFVGLTWPCELMLDPTSNKYIEITTIGLA